MALIAAIQNTRRIYMTFEEFEAAITALTRRSILKFTKAHLIECTKGLLDISNNEVKPFHESAGTYLAEECEEVFVGDLLVDMADLCIRAMRDLGNGPSRPPTELWPKLEDMMQCLRDYPFIAYSMRHWTTYLGSSSSPDAMRAGLRLLDDFENDANIRRMMVLALNTSSSIGFWPGGSKLHVAAWLGFDAAFRETQQEDLALEINAQEPVKRRTPLHMACMRGHYHVALKILQMGADVSMQDRDGCTALWNAIDNSHVATVKVLLQGPHPAKGSKQMRQALNLRNPHYGDQTVLMLAIQRMNGDDQDKIAQLVLRQPDVDPNIQDSAGRTALHIAASLAYSTGLKILTSSRLNDLDFSLRDAAGCTPVIAAISSGQYLGENVQDLLTLFESASRHKTFDADVVEDNGRSLLHYAAMDEVYLPIVKHLKTLGAEINQRDSHNRTPLHNAAYYLKDAEADGVIQTLISMGADLSAEDEQGMTPYDWAVQKGQSWKEIIYHDRKSTQQQGYLIPWDWAFDNPDVFAEELHNVPDEVMDQADPTGCTLLHWAISTGESASVEFLLRSGRVDINAQDLTYNTALHIAIKDIGIGIEIVQLLLEHGADINVPGSWGRRPLEWAFDSQDCNHDFGVAVALIEGGAKLVLAQKKLQEVLRYAIRHDNLRAVEKLLDGGVGPFSYCRPGLLPSETAKEEGASEQMIEMLRHRENNVFGMVADG